MGSAEYNAEIEGIFLIIKRVLKNALSPKEDLKGQENFPNILYRGSIAGGCAILQENGSVWRVTRDSKSSPW